MIDILLATYNGEKYLCDLLTSLEWQTCQEWQLIVADDQSTDKTVSILKRFQRETDHKVTLLINKEPSRSAKKNFFNLMNYSYSPYVMFCDQDDIWLKNKIEKTLSVMKKIEKEQVETPIMVHTDLTVTDEHLCILDRSLYHYSKYNCNFSFNQLLAMNMNTGCTIMANRKLIDMAKKTDCLNDISMHDSWLALIATAFGINAYVDEPLILYRQHSDNTMGACDANSWKYRLSRAFQGEQIKFSNMRRVVEAKAFYNIFGEQLDNQYIKEMLQHYIALSEQSRYCYRQVCWKYGILKYPFSRAVAQLYYAHR